jgi:NitT/TauT family transport system ATP-binding protein
MTPGPGRIRTVVDVPFARHARSWQAIASDPRFVALRDRLLALVRAPAAALA